MRGATSHRQTPVDFGHPREAGADCDRCPIHQWHASNGSSIQPVWPDGPNQAALAIIGGGPGKKEEQLKVPFIGQTGDFLKSQLQIVGLTQGDVWVDQATLCRPPGDLPLDEFEALAVKRHKKRAKESKKSGGDGLLPYKTTVDCCRPRLWKTMRLAMCKTCRKPVGLTDGFQDLVRCTCVKSVVIKQRNGSAPRAILTAGNFALEALTGIGGVQARTGYAMNVGKKGPAYVAAPDPMFLIRGNARLSGLFTHALTRANGLAEGTWKPKWSDADLTIPPANKAIRIGWEKLPPGEKRKPLPIYKVEQAKPWTLAKLKRELAKLGKASPLRVSFDIETDGISALGKKYLLPESKAEVEESRTKEDKECDPTKIRCIGLYTKKGGLLVPVLWRKYRPLKAGIITRWVPYWSARTWRAIVKLLTKFFANAAELITQNGQFDRSVMAESGFDFGDLGDEVEDNTRRHVDTFVSHHTVASYLPHDLGTLTALNTDAPFYKETLEGESWSSESDTDLWLYCARDSKTTFFIRDELRNDVKAAEYNVAKVIEQSHWQERQCQTWTKTGVEVDPLAVRYFRKLFAERRDKALNHLKEMLGKHLSEEAKDGLRRLICGIEEESHESPVVDVLGHFNPGSLNELSFTLAALGIPLREQTLAGLLATGEEMLLTARKELVEQQVKVDDPRLEFLDVLLIWRGSSKIYGTYLSPLVSPIDGRMHPGFKIGPPTGRLASVAPNFQNVPEEIRGIITARKGHKLVSLDWDALELRLAAALSGDEVLLKAFADYDAGIGPKVHVVNMCNIFGLKMEPEKFGGDLIKAGEALAAKFPGMYRAAKVFAYALLYGGTQTTVFEGVRAELPDMDEKSFSLVFERFVTVYHRLMKFQESLVHEGAENKFIRTAVLGRRAYFFEAPRWNGSHPQASEMQNFPYQGTAADIVGLGNRRVENELRKPWQARLQKNEVLLQLAQVHDELLHEVPDRLADEWAKEIKKVCEVDVLGKKIKFPVAVKKSFRWKPVVLKCVCGEKGKIDSGTEVTCKCGEVLSLEKKAA